MDDRPELPEDERAKDEQLFALLDPYVEALHGGARPDRSSVAATPELLSVLDCLDVLHGIASLTPAEAALDEDLTIAATRQDSDCAAAAEPFVSPATLGEFGQYELLEEIGRGGMGVVYRARQTSLDRIVALKMILASHLASPDQIRRFQAEARAAAGLSHPNIVRVFEVGECNGQHYFTMDYVGGTNLAARLAKGILDEAEAVRALIDVARAVDHLHLHGVVHRDLKPSNILLDDDGRPYVTDFGLAKMFVGDHHNTATGLVAGTPSYMSPEQARGNNQAIGPASDVYSLGAILYEMLTRRPPFRARGALDTLLQVLEREPVWPHEIVPTVSRGLELVCMKCLEKSPTDRYGSAAALADELDRYQAGEPLEVQPPRGWQRLRRWIQREPALASRILAVGGFYGIECTSYYVLQTTPANLHWRVTWIVLIWVLASLGFQRLLLLRRPLQIADDSPTSAGENRSSTGGQAGSSVEAAPSSSVLTSRLQQITTRRWFQFSTRAAPFAWATLDAVLLLATMLLRGGLTNQVALGFPLLIALSGLWLRRRLVWYMTALTVVGYLVLAFDFHFVRPELQELLDPSPMRHVYYIVGLLVMAGVVSYQVSRMRALSRYYEKWRRT
ncbi:MAG: serine/threonine-protein kinase [Pirellulales bacterium]